MTRALPRAFIIAVVLGLATSVARANFFDDLAGIATDPLKLNASSVRLSDSIQRALVQIDALEVHGDSIAQQRLDQVRSIVAFALQGGQAVENEAFNKMSSLENQINGDASRLIYQAKCATIVALNGQLQQAIVDATANLSKSDPSIHLFGIKLLDLEFKKVTIENPDQAYFATKQAVLTRLNSSQKDGSQAYEILSTYQNLERVASLTKCHYLGQSLENRFIIEANEMERLSVPWEQVVYPIR